jgi:serine/threonine protein kinase HipA of HipAB toxin-antitoxin module
MDNKIVRKMKKCGWNLECESPLEIRFEDGGSFASGLAAQLIIDNLDRNETTSFLDADEVGVCTHVPTDEEPWLGAQFGGATEFTISVTVDKIRNLGTKILKSTEVSSDHARAFLLLYGGALQDRMNQTIKDFVTEKLV